MKLWICALTFAGFAVAQSGDPIMKTVLARYNYVKQNLVESAEVMPEESYEYRLSPAQRPWAEWIEHNVAMNYRFCSQIAGQEVPKEAVPPGKSKPELAAALKKSFAYCDPIFAAMTDAKAVQPVTMGSRTIYPVSAMIDLLIQWNEHYGNMVGYLRTKGITPPSTARAQKKQ